MIYSLLKHTFTLDLRHINYLWCTRADMKEQAQYYPRRGVFLEFGRFAYRLLRGLRFSLKRPNRTPLPPNSIIFFADSHNQYRALVNVKNQVEKGVLWLDCLDYPEEHYFPSWQARLVSVFFLPCFLMQILRRDFPRWTLGYSLAESLDAYGFFLVGGVALARMRPRALILSNDHCSQPRALMAAAKLLGIRTVYIQHASVTENFPPLEFDLALLDGQDSADKYSGKKSDTRVYLVGNTRRSASVKHRSDGDFGVRFGFAFNISDASEVVEQILHEFRSVFPDCYLGIRPHPADRERFSFFKKVATERGGTFSEPQQESPSVFLSGIDVVIAGHSAILLDAGLMGVLPLQHDALVKGVDAYGYRKTGIVGLIHSATDLVAIIDNLESHRQRSLAALRRYDATFATHFDGKGSELAAKVIHHEMLGQATDIGQLYNTVDGRSFDLRA